VRDDIDDAEWLAALSEDDKLLAALRDALSASEAVPAWFVETAKNAYAWHTSLLGLWAMPSNTPHIPATH
jgi:hypothetical protein